MIDISSIADQLSQRTSFQSSDWRPLLIAAVHDPSFSHMTDGELLQLMRALESPADLEFILDQFREAFPRLTPEMPFDFLWRHVEESEHSLKDWISALRALSENERAAGKQIDFQNLVETVKRDLATS